MIGFFFRISERGIEKNHFILSRLIRPEIAGNISFYHQVMGQETHHPPTLKNVYFTKFFLEIESNFIFSLFLFASVYQGMKVTFVSIFFLWVIFKI